LVQHRRSGGAVRRPSADDLAKPGGFYGRRDFPVLMNLVFSLDQSVDHAAGEVGIPPVCSQVATGR
jgi:hypothetical protein